MVSLFQGCHKVGSPGSDMFLIPIHILATTLMVIFEENFLSQITLKVVKIADIKFIYNMLSNICHNLMIYILSPCFLPFYFYTPCQYTRLNQKHVKGVSQARNQLNEEQQIWIWANYYLRICTVVHHLKPVKLINSATSITLEYSTSLIGLKVLPW